MFLLHLQGFMLCNGMTLGAKKNGQMIAGVQFAIRKSLRMLHINGRLIYGRKLNKPLNSRHLKRCLGMEPGLR